MISPKISIIVPIYNAEKYLNRCINSILSQTFIDFELLLIDDGSSDSSGVICEDFCKKDNRIIVFHKTNEGVAIARNLGLDKAKGDYIYFADSDDTLVENALEILYNNSIKNNADIVFANCNIIKDNDHIDYHKNIQSNSIYEKEEFLDHISTHLSELCFITIWNTLYKKECISNTRFIPSFIVGQDLPFNLEVYKKVGKAVLIEKPLYNYFDIPQTLSRKFTAKKVSIWLKQKQLILDFYESTNRNKNIIYAKRNIHNKLFNCYRELLKQDSMEEYNKARALDIGKIDMSIVFANGFHPKEILVLLLLKFRMFTLLSIIKPIL